MNTNQRSQGKLFWLSAGLMTTLLIIGVPGVQPRTPWQEEAVLIQGQVKSNPEPLEFQQVQQSVEQKHSKYAHAVARLIINAPPEKVWNCLTDFSKYPRIFRRVQSCHIVKREGDLVWVESNLKAHLFVRKSLNHTLNDLKGKPSVLNWHALDGNFDTVRGRWELAGDGNSDRCQVTYTLEVDPGPIIPPFMLSMVLKMVQKEIVTELKSFVEHGQPMSTGYIAQPEHSGT